jgi:hypothetical protein
MDGEEALSSALALEDPSGVLSIYLGVDPEAEQSPHPAWELELRHGLEEALAGLEASGDARGAEAFRARVAGLGEELELLLSPRESGRGRILFAGISGGDVLRVSLQEPFPARVVLGGCALVRPLASALETGRPAGLLLLSEGELRVCEWRLGAVAQLRAIPVLERGDRRQLLGPSAGHPRGSPQTGPGFRASQQRDLYERRAEDTRARFLAHVPLFADLIEERGWDDLVLGGEQALAGALLEHFSQRSGLEVALEPRLLNWLSPAELGTAVATGLGQRRRRRQVALLERVRGQALAGGRGALGLGDTLAALSEGRVELLLLPAERELRGSRVSDGTLFPPGVAPAGVSPAELRPEELMADRMIQRAVSTDAHVTLLGGEAEAALGADEASALLRW